MFVDASNSRLACSSRLSVRVEAYLIALLKIRSVESVAQAC